MKELTLEQKILKHLANKGYITNVAAVTKALKDIIYAEKLITGNETPGIKDDIVEEGLGGGSDSPSECDHQALTNDEIQEVFDNDEEQNS
jgi:hypothetical protein